ncbi:hypothetical protein ACFPVY_01890 [Flavobacterium qiangtangense]|uniref:Uncharacterized protein n=1 Tax=Flavobacterium qiangtangense TaxID=1442595 RepID=A0ABW1PID8_9FLAO
MNSNELYTALSTANGDRTEEMYRYGYACGLENHINFSKIKEAFLLHSISDSEEKLYMHTIIEGYKSSSDFDINLFFG